MQSPLSFALVGLALASGCTTSLPPPPAPASDPSIRAHGGGADIALWVTDGYLSIAEEPVHRKANHNGAVVFTLDNDAETRTYRFPTDAVTFDSPTSEFACVTRNDTTVSCKRTGSAAGKFKYSIKVVLKSDSTKAVSLDPFIITH
jgi:hypothetical protein